MFYFLIRVILIWWILTVLFKWMGRLSAPRNTGSKQGKGDSPDKDAGVVHSGKIEDAEFEEID